MLQRRARVAPDGARDSDGTNDARSGVERMLREGKEAPRRGTRGEGEGEGRRFCR